MTEDTIGRLVGVVVLGASAYIGIFRASDHQRYWVAYLEENPDAERMPGTLEWIQSKYFPWVMRVAGYVSLIIWLWFVWGLVDAASRAFGG